MARVGNGSTTYMEAASAVVTAVPYTMACWAYANALSGLQQRLMYIANQSSDTEYTSIYLSDEEGVVADVRSTAAGIAFHSVSPGGVLTHVDTWYHVAGVFTSTSVRECYLDGVLGTFDGPGTVTPSGFNRTGTHRLGRASPLQYFNGRVAEAAIWNAALTAAEVAQLSDGYSPLFVRPQSIVHYWPLIGKVAPEPDIVGGLSLTNSSTTAGDHYRIRYPKRRQTTHIAGAPPSGNRRRRLLMGV